jgi:molybdate transport system regulatory protein
MRFNFWVEVEDQVVLSLWRVALLEAVEETRSISAAAAKVGVHFRVAWRKIKEMEKRLGVRLVLGQPGGAHGSGAELTREARDDVRRFRQFTQGLAETAAKQYHEAFDDLDGSLPGVMRNGQAEWSGSTATTSLTMPRHSVATSRAATAARWGTTPWICIPRSRASGCRQSSAAGPGNRPPPATTGCLGATRPVAVYRMRTEHVRRWSKAPG